MLNAEELEAETSLRGCTYAGRPFGEESFVSEMAKRFGRYWTRGRPKKESGLKEEEAGADSVEKSRSQFKLF